MHKGLKEYKLQKTTSWITTNSAYCTVKTSSTVHYSDGNKQMQFIVGEQELLVTTNFCI